MKTATPSELDLAEAREILKGHPIADPFEEGLLESQRGMSYPDRYDLEIGAMRRWVRGHMAKYDRVQDAVKAWVGARVLFGDDYILSLPATPEGERDRVRFVTSTSLAVSAWYQEIVGLSLSKPYCWADMVRTPNIEALALLTEPTVRRALRLLDEASSPTGVDTTVLSLAFAYQTFEREGRPFYMLDRDLAILLQNTVLKGVRAEDLHLPFPAMYVDLPKGTGLEVFNEQSGWHELQGVFVTEAWKEDPEGERYRTWRILATGVPKDVPWNDAILYFTVPLYEGHDVDSLIADHQRELAAKGRLGDMAEAWPTLFRWIVNVVLYATNQSVERFMGNPAAAALWARREKAPKGSAKRKKLTEQLRHEDPKWRYRLQSPVVVNRHPGEGPDVGPVEGRAAPTAHRVSGYWRRQPYGPGRSLRRYQFVASYWKGEAKDILLKTHKLK